MCLSISQQFFENLVLIIVGQIIFLITGLSGVELKVAGTAGVGLGVLNIHNHPQKRAFYFVREQNVPMKEELEQVLCLGWTSQVVLVVKNQCRRFRFNSWVGKIPWSRKQQPTPVFLPGEIPWMEEPGGLQSIGLQRIGHGWSDLALLSRTAANMDSTQIALVHQVWEISRPAFAELRNRLLLLLCSDSSSVLKSCPASWSSAHPCCYLTSLSHSTEPAARPSLPSSAGSLSLELWFLRALVPFILGRLTWQEPGQSFSNLNVHMNTNHLGLPWFNQLLNCRFYFGSSLEAGKDWRGKFKTYTQLEITSCSFCFCKMLAARR